MQKNKNKKSKRGFATMDAGRQREIAPKGRHRGSQERKLPMNGILRKPEQRVDKEERPRTRAEEDRRSSRAYRVFRYYASNKESRSV